MPKPRPDFKPPPGAAAQVSIIDTTTSIKGLAVKFLMEPPMEGFETMPEITAWSFLIESSDGRRALYDLGVPPDWYDSFSPATVGRLKELGWEISAQKDVYSILKDGGIEPSSIGSIIWR